MREVITNLALAISFNCSIAKFDLSLHSWDEPIIRVTNEAKKRDQIIGSPMIGEVFDLKTIPTNHWWKNYQP